MRIWHFFVTLVVIFAIAGQYTSAQSSTLTLTHLPDDSAPPPTPVKLVFVHHSTGGNWLADEDSGQPHGNLAKVLAQNNYFVSATNYGWGPEAIGDRTDIPNWPEWFTGASSATILDALYTENGQNFGDFGSWTRMAQDPGGENQVILFKSCFPNSDLYGSPQDPPASEPNEEYTVSNAKAVYNALLNYFSTRQDKLFVAISAPPLMQSETAPDRAANARAFNNWLVNDWLAAYPHKNVAVFDYYNVLTSNDNHHRWLDGQIQHLQPSQNNYSAYPSGDSHPTSTGHQKATSEFVPLLNVFYNRWKSSPSVPTVFPLQATPIEPTLEPTEESVQVEPTSPANPLPAGVIDDFEEEVAFHDEVDQATLKITRDDTVAHSGTTSLRIKFDVKSDGWASLARSFEPPQDWSGSAGVEFWVHSPKAGQSFVWMVYAGEADSPYPFEAIFKTTTASIKGWQKVTFSWKELNKPSWSSADGPQTLDPHKITSYVINISNIDGNPNSGTLWVDDVSLVSSIQSDPSSATDPTVKSPADPAANIENPTAPSAATKVTTKSSPLRGICPSGALIALFGLIFGITKKKRT